MNVDEITNYKKLDRILYDLCELVIAGQKKDSEKYGLVAAAVLDTDNNLVVGINLPAEDGTRRHAERVAIDKYTKKFGDIPKGSIIITTCSPCSEHMDERYGEDCTELLNQYGVRKVYAGYMDPTQEEDHRQFNIIETANEPIRKLCKQFAKTFLDLKENFADGKHPEDKGDSKRLGVPTKSSVSNLRKYASSHSGRKAQLAHWMANMKAGKAKKH